MWSAIPVALLCMVVNPNERQDLRPEKLNLRPERPDLRSQRPDLRPEGPDEGGTNGRTNEQTKRRTKVPLCSTGLCLLRGRCPKKGEEKRKEKNQSNTRARARNYSDNLSYSIENSKSFEGRMHSR